MDIASLKYRRMKGAIMRGWAEGEIHGKVPVLSPLAGMVRYWISETVAMFREDLAG